MDGRKFATQILSRYNFKQDATALILSNCEFEIDDEVSASGGGWVRFGYNGDKTLVHFNTTQEEAAVHELAHAWWYLIETVNGYDKDRMVEDLVYAMLYYAAYPMQKYQRVCDLCRVYRYGDGDKFPGMWSNELQRWNHDEIFAGLASGTMGDIGIMPPGLKIIYRNLFSQYDTYIPYVRAG